MSVIRRSQWIFATGFICATLSATAAARFLETNGVVTIEAEHFTDRHAAPDAHLFARESDAYDPAARPALGQARGGYVIALPNAGQNLPLDPAGTNSASLDYEIHIGNSGTYRLWLRWAGWEDGSDSVYAEIVQLKDGAGGAVSDWYRYSLAGRNSPNFVWQGEAAPELNNGAGGDEPALFALTNGNYTIRIHQREDGVALDAILLQLESLGVPQGNGPAETPVDGLLIAEPPADMRAAVGTAASFKVVALGSSPLSVQWQVASNATAAFEDLAGATNSLLTISSVSPSDDGKLFRARISAGGETAITDAALLKVDTESPRVLAVSAGVDLLTVSILFSEPLEAAETTNLSNYEMIENTNLLAVLSARLDAAGTIVTLATADQQSGAIYQLNISGLKDRFENTMTTAALSFLGATNHRGAARVEIFRNVVPVDPGGLFSSLADLTNSVNFPDHPDETLLWDEISFPSNRVPESDYGARLTASILPPVTGNYRFFLRSSGPAELWLSSTEAPADEKLVARQDSCCDPFLDEPGISTNEPGLASFPLHLEAGHNYSLRAIWTHNVGPDTFAVSWLTPFNGDPVAFSDLSPIPDFYLETIAGSTGEIVITRPPADFTAAPWTPALFSVEANALSAFGSNAVVQWQHATSGTAEFTDLPGANSTELRLPMSAPWHNGSQFRALVQNGFASATSAPAVLTVSGEVSSPSLLKVSSSLTSALLFFDRPLEPSTATNPANFLISSPAAVRSSTLLTTTNAPAIVQLDLANVVSGGAYNLTFTNLTDAAGLPFPENTHALFTTFDVNESFGPGSTPFLLSGSARIRLAGDLQLTPAGRHQQGSAVLPEILRGVPVHDFVATFRVFIGEGSGDAGDGFSFCIAPDLATNLDSIPTFGEEGAGHGLTLSVDTYDNGNGDAPSISLKWAGTEPVSEFARTNLAKGSLVSDRWVDVSVRMDGRGRVTVDYDGIRYFQRVSIPNWTPTVGPQIGFGARTGSEYAAHRIDDVQIVFNAEARAVAPQIVFSRENGELQIVWTGGGTLQGTQDLKAPRWTDVAEESPTSVSILNAARFYRVIRY